VGRRFLLLVLPILVCVVIFQLLLVFSEDLKINVFTGERPPSGAPFLVGSGTVITPGGPVTPTGAERFSFLWFGVDVLVTAAIAIAIAWFLRIPSAWPPSVASTVVIGWMVASASSPPIPLRSFGFSFWVYWLLAFALTAAVWTGIELYRARPRRG
jgi:hypothetical protein